MIKVGISEVKMIDKDTLQYKDNIRESIVQVHYKAIEKATIENMPNGILMDTYIKLQKEFDRRGL